MTEIEAAWLAGLFEGEGCITAKKAGNQRFLAIKMTDEDVVRKAHLIAGVGKVYGPYRAVNSKVRDTSHYKPFWQWSVFARDEVLLVGNAILPHLGERRRAKMLEALDAVSKLADARKSKEKQMALEERAMLVRLSVSQWYNRALDRKVAEEVATKYEVSSTDSQDLYIKTLLPKVAMRNVNRAISELRTFHYANTLPWQDDSVRIISSAAFFSYQQGMLERKMTLETEVEQLVANYPSWLKHARETKKGLFDEAQYPSAQALRAAFGVRITFLPFPHVDDFRVQGLSEEQIADIKAQTKAELTATLSQASQNLIDRIYERLYTLYQALEPEKVFRDNTVTSIQETIELVEKLNIADDERVNLTCDAVRTEMTGTMIPLLRSDPTYRLRVRAQVAELLNTINPNYKDTKQ